MSNSALLVIAVSALAGTTIRAWAFALLTVVVVASTGLLSLIEGTGFLDSAKLCIKLLVLMEIGYLTGLFGSHLGGHFVRRRKRTTMTDNRTVTGDPPTV